LERFWRSFAVHDAESFAPREDLAACELFKVNEAPTPAAHLRRSGTGDRIAAAPFINSKPRCGLCAAAVRVR
jgi:hypothetical protein